MSNPFYKGNANAQQNNSQQITLQQAYQHFMQKANGNPMNLFMSLASQNPQLQPALQMLQNGMNPEQVFNSVCQTKGLNPQEVLKSFMG